MRWVSRECTDVSPALRRRGDFRLELAKAEHCANSSVILTSLVRSRVCSKAVVSPSAMLRKLELAPIAVSSESRYVNSSKRD